IAGIKVEEEIIRDLERLDIKLYVRGQHGYWDSLRVKPDLISRIKEAQKEDNEIWTIVKIEHQWASGLLQPLDIPVWKWDEISMDFVTGLPRTQRRHDTIWVVVDRLTKYAHFLPICKDYSASGLLQPLDIPIWKWDEIPMDFVTGLPQTQRRHDAIWVVVDRLTKSAHFLPIRKDYSVSRLAEIFQQEIVRLHGTPSAIVSDRDPRFTSRFWKGLRKAWGTRLKFSTTFHPQTDGQSERTIQTLEDMLRSCALEWSGNWDDYICLDQVGERVIERPEMIEVTNAKVVVAKEKLKEARTRQKSYADKHHRSLEFQPCDHVLLKVSPARGVRRFGIKGKLSPRFIGPF
nr:retrotransposon protein, putative, Ty3-gypsy subclass [Tanacetum cinerariifolium]